MFALMYRGSEYLVSSSQVQGNSSNMYRQVQGNDGNTGKTYKATKFISCMNTYIQNMTNKEVERFLYRERESESEV